MKHNWHRRRSLFSRSGHKQPAGQPVAAPQTGGFWGFVGTALRRTCTVIGAMVLVLTLLTFSISQRFQSAAKPLPASIVLQLNLEGGLSDNPTPATSRMTNPFAVMQPDLQHVIRTLDHAAQDARVKGVITHFGPGGLELAHVQELRAALKSFREAGKFAYAYASSYGEAGNGLGAYYLAAAHDQIWLQPVGIVSLTGIAIEMPFGRDALQKLGVRAEFFQRKEYKTAFENFTAPTMSAPNREMLGDVLDDLGSQFVTDVAADRKIPEQRLRAAVDQRGLLMSDEAKRLGLVDWIDYETLLEAQAVQRAGNNAGIVDLDHYADDWERQDRKAAQKAHPGPGRARIAQVHIDGMIAESTDPSSAMSELLDALKEIEEDDSYKALVIRVNSPGGSPAASETIRHAIAAVKHSGKKIYVSMGPTAASGGYWVSVNADRIYALPSTLTGSIGVVAGKFDLSGMWEKMGVTWDHVSWGKNAAFWSMNEPFNADGAERINVMLDDVYDAFVTRVADGRHMDRAAVEAVARGRVWTGQSAYKVGLVDSLGGLTTVYDDLAKELGVGTRQNLAVQLLPRPRNPLEQLLNLMQGQASALLPGWIQQSLSRLHIALPPQGIAVYEPFSME